MILYLYDVTGSDNKRPYEEIQYVLCLRFCLEENGASERDREGSGCVALSGFVPSNCYLAVSCGMCISKWCRNTAVGVCFRRPPQPLRCCASIHKYLPTRAGRRALKKKQNYITPLSHTAPCPRHVPARLVGVVCWWELLAVSSRVGRVWVFTCEILLLYVAARCCVYFCSSTYDNQKTLPSKIVFIPRNDCTSPTTAGTHAFLLLGATCCLESADTRA